MKSCEYLNKEITILKLLDSNIDKRFKIKYMIVNSDNIEYDKKILLENIKSNRIEFSFSSKYNTAPYSYIILMATELRTYVLSAKYSDKWIAGSMSFISKNNRYTDYINYLKNNEYTHFISIGKKNNNDVIRVYKKSNMLDELYNMGERIFNTISRLGDNSNYYIPLREFKMYTDLNTFYKETLKSLSL